MQIGNAYICCGVTSSKTSNGKYHPSPIVSSHLKWARLAPIFLQISRFQTLNFMSVQKIMKM